MPTRRLTLPRLLPVALAVLAAVVAAQSLARGPRYFGPLFAMAALMSLPAALARWRMRRLLMSGDVERLLGTWRGAVEGVPHRETMVPLLQATAYAAYGWLDAGRRALQRALPGPAWDAAIEQRLFVETLLDTFDGDRDGAVRKAALLETMPMPVSGLFARRRIVVLRRGLTALTRAFSHASREGDLKALSKAAGASPLVHWAMRYAAAIVAIDRGKAGSVRGMLASAPPWPKDSVFRNYHDELMDRANHDLVAVSD